MSDEKEENKLGEMEEWEHNIWVLRHVCIREIHKIPQVR